MPGKNRIVNAINRYISDIKPMGIIYLTPETLSGR